MAQSALRSPAKLHIHGSPLQRRSVVPGRGAAPAQRERAPRRRGAVTSRAAKKPGGGGPGKGDDVIDSILKLADKYAGLGLPPPKGQGAGARRAAPPAAAPPPFRAVHALLLSLAAAWAAAALLGLPPPAALALDRARPWTALADAWLSPGPELLCRNLFFGYIFGRTVDTVEGGQGLWLTWLLSAAGGSAAALLLLPRRAPLVGCGMSGALFGLFAAATLFNPAKDWHWHRWFELAVLLPFAALQLAGPHAALAPLWAVGGAKLGAWAPLLGGLAGAAAAAAVMRLGRVVAAGIQQQQAAAAQQQQQQPPGGGGGAPEPQEPLSALLSRAAALAIRRLVV
ncbi:MAG: hypothetical protein J3K34DRAFT_460366 [Monoraphidium minutum]|nr:MAG: hypothetical protein J3K34DRAFT_460366 [Monoraphidium minutum]